MSGIVQRTSCSSDYDVLPYGNQLNLQQHCVLLRLYPLLVGELDLYLYQAQTNNTKTRYSQLKTTPHKHPCKMCNHPKDYDSDDFSVSQDKH